MAREWPTGTHHSNAAFGIKVVSVLLFLIKFLGQFSFNSHGLTNPQFHGFTDFLKNTILIWFIQGRMVLVNLVAHGI